MAYEIHFGGDTLIADYHSSYLAGPDYIPCDRYDILRQERGVLGEESCIGIGHVSIETVLQTEPDGGLNPAFRHAILYAFDASYASEHDEAIRCQKAEHAEWEAYRAREREHEQKLARRS